MKFFSRLLRGSWREAVESLRSSFLSGVGGAGLQSAQGVAIPLGFGWVWMVGWTRVEALPKDREELQAMVVRGVKAQLGREPWFKGVCLDRLGEFQLDQVQEAVEACGDETVYWDAPNSGF